MHKYCKVLLVLCLLMLIPGLALSSVGVKDDGTKIGIATDINFTGDSIVTRSGSVINVDTDMSTSLTLSGSLTFETNLAANGIGNGGVSEMESDILEMPVSGFTMAHKDIEATNKTSILTDGIQGQVFVILIESAAGGTWHVVPDTSIEFLSMDFNAAEDKAVLLYVDDTSGWIILSSTSVDVTAK